MCPLCGGSSKDIEATLLLLSPLFGRKFSDIGNTVQLQYTSPALHLSSGWAELVTSHALPGPGVVEGLKEVAVEGSGCVVVVEMSSQGSLTTQDYVRGI